MNSLYTYYNNVQKMAAFRQAKRLQRGVKLGYKQFGNGVNDTRFESAPIPIGTSDFSLELYMNSYGSNQSYPFAFNKRVYSVYAKGSIFLHNSNSYENGIYSILMEAPADGESNADSIYPSWQAPTADEKYLLTITRQGTTVKAYINGELKVTKEQSEVKDMGDLQLAIANSSDVGFVRVWNMCLSADDVTAHYNNGDPMGYVVPKLYRQFGSDIEPASDTYEFNIGSPYFNVVLRQQSYPFDCIYRVDYIVNEWDFQPQVYSFAGMLGVAGANIISGAVSWGSIEYAKIGEAQSLLVKMPGSGLPALFIYGGTDNESATARRLKVTINSVTPVGILAEYLPQNLMFGRDDKAIATSWLDSAKQLPLSDEYMEPLFQSIGGYDMAANGVPEILYNE